MEDQSRSQADSLLAASQARTRRRTAPALRASLAPASCSLLLSYLHLSSASQAPTAPPFPPFPPPPPQPPGAPPAASAQAPERKDVTFIYAMYGTALGAFAVGLLGYCLWKATALLRTLNKEYSEVVSRREFMEEQEARLTGKPREEKRAKPYKGASKAKLGPKAMPIPKTDLTMTS
jgi:hypothetical protein